MPKTLFCNNFEIGHNKEAFCLIFKFQSPDGNIVESAYVTISPSGTKTFMQLVKAEMEAYEKKHGQVEPWKSAENLDSHSQSNGATEKYRV